MAARENPGIESELKYSLSEMGYNKLLSHFKRVVRPKDLLTSYYFDTPKLDLQKMGFGLRIRIINKREAIVTLKADFPGQKQRLPRGFKVRSEEESPISLAVAKKLIEGRSVRDLLRLRPVRGLQKALPKALLTQLQTLGSIEMVRTCIPQEYGAVLELDAFRIFTKWFYELEVETEAPYETARQVKAVLRRLRIPVKPGTRSKLERLLKVRKASTTHAQSG